MEKHRVLEGDRFQIVGTASAVAELRARVVVEFDDGKTRNYERVIATTADQVSVTGLFGKIEKRGSVVRATVTTPTALRRGQCFVELVTLDTNNRLMDVLAQDYIHNNNQVALDREMNPLEGRGHLHWVQEANDAAGNAVTTVSLAQTNTRRIVRSIVVKYHQAGGGAITLTITLRDIATAVGPTGWTIDSDTWVSPTLTLGANEQGLIHVDEHGFVALNDAGVLSYADNTSAPNPFPLEFEDGETGDLLIAAGSGASGDDYDVWVKYEDWIEI